MVQNITATATIIMGNYCKGHPRRHPSDRLLGANSHTLVTIKPVTGSCHSRLVTL